MACYVFDLHEPILILFGRNITQSVSNKKTLFPPHLTDASLLPGKKHRSLKIVSCHYNAVLLHCQTSCSRCLIFFRLADLPAV